MSLIEILKVSVEDLNDYCTKNKIAIIVGDGKIRGFRLDK